MEIKVYYSELFSNENSILEALSNIEFVKDKNDFYQRINTYIEGEGTTLKELYRNGWRLNKVVPAHNSNTNFFFFMEK